MATLASGVLIKGRYRLEAKLDEGGMGIIYTGFDTETGQKIAIKQLRSDLTQVEEQLGRFNRESDMLSQLAHPNIMQVLDTVQENSNYYIIMEYIQGGSLAQQIKESGPMFVDDVLGIALDLVDALTRVHRLNIVHRDIKPANVLMRDDGVPLLMDFGVACFTSLERMTETGSGVIGTADYMSPDLFMKMEIDERTDIWSFGVMLFEMLTGERPFVGPNMAQLMMAILNNPTPDISELRPDIPESLAALINKMLQKDREKRIGSIRQVGAALDVILRGGEPDEIALAERDMGRGIIEDISMRHNLPASVQVAVGYEDDKEEITRMLDGKTSRLVTVTGLGGGAPRNLILSSALTQVGKFPDGVYVVTYGQDYTREAFVAEIVSAIGMEISEEIDLKKQLFEYLRFREMLLVLNNVDETAIFKDILEEILQHAPGVMMLIWSLTPLGIEQESVVDQSFIQNRRAERLLTMGIQEYSRSRVALSLQAYLVINKEIEAGTLTLPPEAESLWRVSRKSYLQRRMTSRLSMLTLTSLIFPIVTIPFEFIEGASYGDAFLRLAIRLVGVFFINVSAGGILTLIEFRGYSRNQRLWMLPLGVGAIFTLFSIAGYPTKVFDFENLQTAIMTGATGGLIIGLLHHFCLPSQRYRNWLRHLRRTFILAPAVGIPWAIAAVPTLQEDFLLWIEAPLGIVIIVMSLVIGVELGDRLLDTPDVE